MVSCFMAALTASVSTFSDKNPAGFDDNQIIAAKGILDTDLHYKPIDIYRNAQNSHFKKDDYFTMCCCMLINFAFESVSNENDFSPEFEFFRNLRNACSHGNSFHFNHNQPKRPTAWRTLTLDHRKKGNNNPMQGRKCIGSFIGISDTIHLLKDIENKIIRNRAEQ